MAATSTSRRWPWSVTALSAGILYLLIGTVTASLAGRAGSQQGLVRWRFAAYLVSAAVFTAHLAHEHFRLRNPPKIAAWHTAFAVALGGFGLALLANVHELGSAAGYRPRMLLSLGAWPLLTGVPAFLVGLVLATLLGALGSRKSTR